MNLSEAIQSILNRHPVSEAVASLLEAKGTPEEQITAAVEYLKDDPTDIKNWDNVYLLLRKHGKNILLDVDRTKSTTTFGGTTKKSQKGTFYMYGSSGPKSSINPMSRIPGFTTLVFHKWPAKSTPKADDVFIIEAVPRSMLEFARKLKNIRAS